MVHNKSGMPLMFGYNPKGDGMVYAHKFDPDTQTAYIAYGFVPSPSTNGKRDDYFNEEDFTSGGLEAGFSYNQASDGGYLSTQNDFGQMDHEVSCTYSGLGYNALEFQIYDNSKFGIFLNAAAQLKVKGFRSFRRDTRRQVSHLRLGPRK